MIDQIQNQNIIKQYIIFIKDVIQVVIQHELIR